MSVFWGGSPTSQWLITWLRLVIRNPYKRGSDYSMLSKNTKLNLQLTIWLGRFFPLKMHVCKNLPKHLDHIWQTLAIVALVARCSLKLLGHPSDIRPYIHRWFTIKSLTNPLVRPYFLQVGWHWYPKSSDNKHPARTPFKKTVASKRTFAAASTQDQNQGWPTYAKDDV